MVGMPSDFQWLAFKVFADSTQITVKFCCSGGGVSDARDVWC